ncbi:aldo/keto reductase [Streptomyces sp. BI20]|uniref:aldo/keto reductase n=1 Tax=Streptomyces sp. BI20 TaxID=3403460 RepID=UPI003C78F2A0
MNTQANERSAGAAGGPRAVESGTWSLGDRSVYRLGFGAMRLTHTADGSPSDRDRAVAVLRAAVESGVNHVDTAAFYFSALRSANELIGRALAPYAEDLTIATKVGPGRRTDGSWWWARPEELRGQVEENLRQLGRDHLDLVNLRVPPNAATSSVAEHFGALAEVREAGLVRHLGVSNVTAGQLAEARAVAPVVCVQNAYGIGADPAAHALVETCGEAGIAFVPFFAIAGASREGGVPADDDPVVHEVARERGLSAAQVRLAWSLTRGPHVLAIPGTGNPAHLRENVAAGAIRLTGAEMSRLAGGGPDAG